MPADAERKEESSGAKRSNHEGNLRKRIRTLKDGTQTVFWEGRIQVGWVIGPDGSRTPDVRSVYGRTRQQVLEKMKRLRRQAEEGKLPSREAARVTVRDYLTAWLEHHRRFGGRNGEGLRPDTVRNYENIIKRYIAPAPPTAFSIGHLTLQQVTPDHPKRLYEGIDEAARKRAEARKRAPTLQTHGRDDAQPAS